MVSGGITVQIEGTESARVLRVAGPLDIAHAGQLRTALLEASEASGGESSTLVDLASLTAVDLSGLQLLCSAHRSFAARGGAIGIRSRPQWFSQATAAAGFTASAQACGPGLCGDCLWRE